MIKAAKNSSLFSNSVETLKSSSSSSNNSLNSNFWEIVVVHKKYYAKSKEPTHFVLQTLKTHYGADIERCTYRLSNRYSPHHDTIFRYIVELAKKVRSPMEAHFFNQKIPTELTRFSAIFKQAFETNCVLKGAAKCVLSNFEHETLSNELISPMYAESSVTSSVASLRN